MGTSCLECNEPIAQPATGRPRLYCSGRCRQAAQRRKHLTAGLVATRHLQTVGVEHGSLPPAADPDQQVAVAILEARNLSGAFIRLGREARPQLAWRCEGAGVAITEALHRYFEEIG
jgi:hypothetical protein